MSSFEWMELQTLTGDIDLSRSRLVEARRNGDQGRVTALEEEITRAEKRRLQLLAHISTNIVTSPEPSRAKGKEGAGARQAADADAAEDGAKGEQSPAETARAGASAPRARAREGAGSRQAAAPAAEASPEQPPAEAVAAPEPAPSAKAKESAGSRSASVPPAEAVQDAATAEKPLAEPARATEPAPPPKAAEDAGSRQVPAAPAAASREQATAEQPRGETAGTREPAPSPKAGEGVVSRQAPAPAAEASPDGASREQPLPDRVDRIVASGAHSPAPALRADSVEGGRIVWDQLTPGDIERVKSELGLRRAEMMARHAEELRGLEAEQSQLETLEQAIDMFLRKAKRPESAAA